MPSSLMRARVRAVLATAGIAAGTVLVAGPGAHAAPRPATHQVAAHLDTGPARDAAPTPPRHVRPLHLGSRGDTVRWVQHRLGVHTTGYFGHRTRQAVRHFQRRHHLRPDGVVGRRTWHALLRGRHATAHHAPTHRHVPLAVQAARVLRVAARQAGKPYVYGANGPHAFDCSGLVQYVFRQAVGKHLPHNTDAQWAVIRHIRRSKLRPGDLIYVRAGGHLEHVGIYAGHGTWWEAPHTGSHVLKRRIWSTHVVYGRVV